MQVPAMCDAVVVGVDGDGYRLFVSLQGGMGAAIPSIPVAVAIPGYCDGVRGRRPPLPVIGTHGRVSFTRGDIRNGRWEGAHPPALIDSASHTAATPHLDHTAHYDGGFSWRGQDGTAAEVYADGSYLLIGAALPQPTRHTLAADQSRQTVPFGPGQRNPSSPKPMQMQLRHATGAVVTISAAGAVSMSPAAGQPFTITANGGSITIDANGKVAIVDAGGAAIDMANNSTVAVTGNAAVSQNITATQDISDQNGTHGTVGALRADYNAHAHGNVQNGGGTTAATNRPTT